MTQEYTPNFLKNKPPHLKELYACLQCGYCKSVCPVYRETGWESLTPRGKVYTLKQLIDKNSFLDKILGKKITNKLTGRGEIPIDETVTNIYNCSLCSRCETICHVDIPFHEYWEEVRTWLVNNGLQPPENAVNMYKYIANKEYKNPFMEAFEKRNEWYRDDYKLPETADTIYFIGCVASFHEYQVLLNTLKVLTTAQVDFTTLGQDEMCCGAINAMTGQWQNFKEIVEYNVGQIEKRGATRVVTGCPGCYRAFKKYKNFTKCNFELKHTSEVIAELINNEKITFSKEFKEKNLPLVYHDPCELGRISEMEGKGIFEPPRHILENIPGISEVLEYPNNRMNSSCCGGGGGLKAANYDLTMNIAVRKVDDAIELGAKTIASTCPNCKGTIGTAVEMKKEILKKQDKKLKIKVMDVVEIAAKAL